MVVITTFKTRGAEEFKDKWFKYDTFEECQKQYKAFQMNESLYSASIVEVVESTDYTPTNILATIDYKELKSQKELLLILSEQFDSDSDMGGALTGILNLVDSIQDKAVEFNYTTEEEAFNLTEE